MPALILTPNESDVFTALRSFLLSILPSGAAAFTASVSGSVMTVSGVSRGAIAVNDRVLGEFVAAGTTVAAQITGAAGGAGTYTVSPGGQAAPSRILTTGVDVVQSQVNRVAEPIGDDFALMTMARSGRLSTNVDVMADAVFVGSIAGTTLTVSSVEAGTVSVGATVFGAGVAQGTVITAAGAPGIFSVSPTQTAASARLAAGGKTMTQPSMVTVQIDVHGPNSSDHAQTIATAFRDDFAVQFFASLGQAISPLHADDPRQMPFINAEQQYEDRWVVEANLQVNQTARVPQQFSDAVTVTIVPVDEAYPVS